jgi:hypothetical protein
MKRFFALLMIAAAVPCASVRADDQGPVGKTTNTVKKAAHETSNVVVNGAKATGTAVSNGAKATERTVGKGLQKAGNRIHKAGNNSASNNSQG